MDKVEWKVDLDPSDVQARLDRLERLVLTVPSILNMLQNLNDRIEPFELFVGLWNAREQQNGQPE